MADAAQDPVGSSGSAPLSVAAQKALPRSSKASDRRAENLSLGLPHFCRQRYFVRGANVFAVPVWDLPSRWCPEEVKRATCVSTIVADTAAIEAPSGTLYDLPAGEVASAGSDNDARRVMNRTDDDDSGSESEQSDVCWEGVLGAASRAWARAAIDGGLLLVRSLQAAVQPTGAGRNEESDDAVSNVVDAPNTFGLAVSACLFPQRMIAEGSDVSLDQRLAEVLKVREPRWAVCALRSGRFAGAVFNGPEAVCHKAIHRYTIRAKSGGSQSAQDSTGKKTKSAGSTLRRYGQQRLAEEVQELMGDKWATELQACDLVFVSVSKRMRATLLGAEGRPYVPPAKVRRLPFVVGRPTFEAVKEAHLRVASIIFAEQRVVDTLTAPFRPVPEPAPLSCPAPEQATAASTPLPRQQVTEEPARVEYVEADDELFGPLHEAAAVGDEARILELLDDGADPGARDSKGRVPYYLCPSQRAREAFRRWRGANEDAWDWQCAQVPEGITEEVEQRRKDKDKEKKKRQKERQKASKAQARADDEERRKVEEAEAKVLEAAQTKCDNCGKAVVDKPFSRLSYFYCSSECVSAHRRELQAQAAMKRFNSSTS